MRRPPLLVLLGFGLLVAVGLALVLTADDEDRFDTVTTAEGVTVEVPRGWVVSEEFVFQYVPPGADQRTLDLWSVAWACPLEGCAARSLEDWLAAAPELPTFVGARAEDGQGLFDLEETSDERSWVLTARAENDLRIVNVAVFHDGAERYLACNLVVQGDPRGLDDAIVDACRDAEVPT